MLIGSRLRQLRTLKNLSQGDIEKRTGLLRCYTSRVENGHTVPSVDTLEKYARALEVPLYQLFHNGEQPILETTTVSDQLKNEVELTDGERRQLRSFGRAFARMDERNRKLFLVFATVFANRRTEKHS